MIKPGSWLTEDLAHAVLVRPLDDIVVHTATEVCVCAPSVETSGKTCTCLGWPGTLAVRKMITHHAMDGRE